MDTLLHLKPTECNGNGETVAQIPTNLQLKIDHGANVEEDVLSMIFQQNEKENIVQFGDPGAKTNLSSYKLNDLLFSELRSCCSHSICHWYLPCCLISNPGRCPTWLLEYRDAKSNE